MQVTLEIPDDVGSALIAGALPPDRAALEGIASEGYRAGMLSEYQVMRLLGMESRFEVHAWLRDRRIPYQYTEKDLAEDLATLTKLGLR